MVLKIQRRIVRVATDQFGNLALAVADDGTLWKYGVDYSTSPPASVWSQIKPLPDREDSGGPK